MAQIDKNVVGMYDYGNQLKGREMVDLKELDYPNEFGIRSRFFDEGLRCEIFVDWTDGAAIMRYGDDDVMFSVTIKDVTTHEVTHAAMNVEHILERLEGLQAKREEHNKAALSGGVYTKVINWFHEVEAQLELTVVVAPDVKVIVLEG